MRQIPAMDGVRGLAVLLVATHNLRLITESTGGGTLPWVQLLDRGWIGVQLFFVLSGFLITRILRETDGAPNYFRAFYTRRALRILPLYYITLVVGLLLVRFPHNTTTDWSLWLFVSNYTEPFHSQSAFTHFWSLAVEEQFYLLWPLLLHRRSSRYVFWLCGALAAASLVIRIGMLAAGMPWEAAYEFTPSRMDALVLGGVVALLPSITLSRWLPGIVLVLGGAITRGYSQTGVLTQTIGYSLLSIAFALWIRQESQHSSSWLSSPLLSRFGKYSYCIYVIHLPLKALVAEPLLRSFGFRPSLTVDVAFVTLSLAAVYVLAALSYRFFEGPLLRLKPAYLPVNGVQTVSRPQTKREPQDLLQDTAQRHADEELKIETTP